MGDVVNQRIFQDMRERSVSDVMHQDGRLDSLCFGVKDEISLFLKRPHRLGHQVKSTDGMLKSCVTGTRIDHRSQSQLIDTVQALKQGMLYDAVEQPTRYLDESEYRVVDDLCAVHLIILYQPFSVPQPSAVAVHGPYYRQSQHSGRHRWRR